MDNKKGFTLVELIATIVLIALSSTIIVLNLQGSSSKEEGSLSDKNDKKIIEAACNAIDSINAFNIIGETRDSCKANSNGCDVSLQKLINSGLIDAYANYDDTGKTIEASFNTNSSQINIKWISDGEYLKKTCTFNKVTKN